MGSELPSPHSSPEMNPVQQGKTNPETAPLGGAEVAPGQGAPERQPSVETRETKTQPSGGSQPAQAPAPTLPPAVPPVAQDDDVSQQSTAQDNNPATASDDDLIEREWVDKAKKIVSETKNDPYLQEKEVSKLQADYLKKRWGRELNVPND